MQLEFRKALTRAFKTLRKRGYFASHNFACCATCSWDMVSWDQAGQAVFYHDQDKANADQGHDLPLFWQGNLSLIRQALEAEGLTVNHDGNKRCRIYVVNPAREAR